MSHSIAFPHHPSDAALQAVLQQAPRDLAPQSPPRGRGAALWPRFARYRYPSINLFSNRFPRLLALAILAGAAVASPAQAADAARPALQVHGQVSSPVFDELTRLAEVRQDAAPGAGGAVLVVDGDAFTPQALAHDAQVRAALGAGRWVLALDVTAEHKRAGLGALLGAANGADSRAYLVRLAAAKPDAPRDTWIVDPGRAEDEQDRFLRQRWGAAFASQGIATSPSAADLARQVLEFVGGQVRLPLPRQDSPIPNGLLYKRYFFPYNITRALPKTAISSGTQTTNVTLLATYQIFLDNSGNPQGDFQYVAFTLDGLANPTNGARQIAADWEPEHAWLQSLIAVSVQPAGVDLDFVATAPANRNGETTYVDDATFNVGFDLPSGPSGNFTWGSQQTYTITDWVALARSAGLIGAWDFASAKPGNGLATDLVSCDAGWMRTCFFQSGLPNAFNVLNVNALAFHTEQVWKTRQPVNTLLGVTFTGYQQLLDAYCTMHSPGACWGGEGVNTTYNPWAATHFIDLGSVLPAPITALTFDPPQAVAGQPVTATLTLARPAPADVVVMLASNSQNATVLPTVTVAQGQTSAQFQVLTNDNGLPPNGGATATLTAFYATNFQSQLRISAR